jgi:hypothetical protein
MTDELDTELSQASFKKKTMIVGPVLGAAIGLVSAYMLIQSMEKRDTELKISASEGVSMAFIVMALIRQIAELPDKRK